MEAEEERRKQLQRSRLSAKGLVRARKKDLVIVPFVDTATSELLAEIAKRKREHELRLRGSKRRSRGFGRKEKSRTGAAAKYLNFITADISAAVNRTLEDPSALQFEVKRRLANLYADNRYSAVVSKHKYVQGFDHFWPKDSEVRQKVVESIFGVKVAAPEPSSPAKQVVAASDRLSVLLASVDTAMRRAVTERPELEARVRLLEEDTLVSFRPHSGVRSTTSAGASVESSEQVSRHPDANVVGDLVNFLHANQLRVIFIGSSDVVASGSAEAVQRLVGVRLALHSIRGNVAAQLNEEVLEPDDLYVGTQDGHVLAPQGQLAEYVSQIVFYPPALPLASPLLATPPGPPAFHHLDKAAIRSMLGCPSQRDDSDNSESSESSDLLDGSGVKVAVLDTGVYAQHPAFAQVNAKISGHQVIRAPSSLLDPIGHGTGMAWNVLTCAPQAEILSISMGRIPIAALEAARDSDADIVVCCFEYDYFESIADLIRQIVARGKVVLAASGNGTRTFPGNMPEIISIGGVYKDPAGQLNASDFASGYVHTLANGTSRLVPDVCGPCGQAPAGVYYAMPTEPSSVFDRRFGSKPFDQGDGGPPDDGWWHGSGTSGATSLVAGVCALLLEKSRSTGVNPVISTDFIRKILQSTATPVLNGQNAMGTAPSATRPNDSVGYGLVNATAALAVLSGP